MICHDDDLTVILSDTSPDGGKVMPHRFMSPDRLIKLMSDEGVTISAGVPTIWQGVKSIMEAQPGVYDLSKLERLTCGGSAPPLSLIAWYWNEHNVEMVQGWGMTETSPLGTVSRRVMKRSQLDADPQQLVENQAKAGQLMPCLLYTSPSPRDATLSRMPSSA